MSRAADKQRIRREAHARRAALADKDSLSGAICQRVLELPAVAGAHALLVYVDVRDEVRTRPLLRKLLGGPRQVVVPFVDSDRLALFHLGSESELVAGAFGVPEPAADLRGQADRRVELRSIDAILTPGVAFDRCGARMGHGLGYYDRLLEAARDDCTLIGLAFECQLFDEIPVETHDVFMDYIVTELAVHAGTRRQTRT